MIYHVLSRVVRRPSPPAGLLTSSCSSERRLRNLLAGGGETPKASGRLGSSSMSGRLRNLSAACERGGGLSQPEFSAPPLKPRGRLEAPSRQEQARARHGKEGRRPGAARQGGCRSWQIRIGWGGRIRTPDILIQSQTCYHCTTPQRRGGVIVVLCDDAKSRARFGPRIPYGAPLFGMRTECGNRKDGGGKPDSSDGTDPLDWFDRWG